MARLEIEILDVAKSDFREAVEWYRDSTSPKTARKTAASFAKTLDQIALFPKGCPVFRGSVRRIGLSGFRYWLYYAEVGGASRSLPYTMARPSRVPIRHAFN